MKCTNVHRPNRLSISQLAAVIAIVVGSLTGAISQAQTCAGMFASMASHSERARGVDPRRFGYVSQDGAPAFVGLVPSDGQYYVHSGAPKAFFDLAMQGKLLGQMDPRLDNRKLLLKDGGLCGPTCGVNIMHSLYNHSEVPTQEFVTHPEQHLNQMLNYVWQKFKRDGRYGLNTDQLEYALKEVTRELTGDTSNLSTYKYPMGDYAESDFFTVEDRLKLALVTVGETANHFIVILGLNTADKKVTYADPNNPGAIFTADYVVTNYKGHQTINIGWDGIFNEANGSVVDLMDIFQTGIKENYSAPPWITDTTH